MQPETIPANPFSQDPQVQALLATLTSPAAIQAYLDSLPYTSESRNRSPLNVVRDGTCHCLDGGLLAAAALRRLGYPPLIVDIQPDPGMDDDHVLAIYRQNGGYGCLAKSNYPTLRSREAVYRSLRELAMSYFDIFFNLHLEKTLRYYTLPLDLRRLDTLGWEWQDSGVDRVEELLKTRRRFPLLRPGMAEKLAKLDPFSAQAFTLGVNWDGVYQPREKP
jgi:hypothetical protein